jgi:hypothetical protein
VRALGIKGKNLIARRASEAAPYSEGTKNAEQDGSGIKTPETQRATPDEKPHEAHFWTRRMKPENFAVW